MAGETRAAHVLTLGELTVHYEKKPFQIDLKCVFIFVP